MAKQSPIDQFNDGDMNQIKRIGQALGAGPTPFSEEVERHLRMRQRARSRRKQRPLTEGMTEAERHKFIDEYLEKGGFKRGNLTGGFQYVGTDPAGNLQHKNRHLSA
jgi:hypothetical protein